MFTFRKKKEECVGMPLVDELRCRTSKATARKKLKDAELIETAVKDILAVFERDVREAANNGWYLEIFGLDSVTYSQAGRIAEALDKKLTEKYKCKFNVIARRNEEIVVRWDNRWDQGDKDAKIIA